jgi:hypothetical protein
MSPFGAVNESTIDGFDWPISNETVERRTLARGKPE